MLLSELIRQLQEELAEHGDLPVSRQDNSDGVQLVQSGAYFYVMGDEHEDNDPDDWVETICID